MQSHLEREAFSRRLHQLLVRVGHPDAGPTELAREFNRRYPGTPVTLHAARKWLQGEAIPAQARMRVLAHWFGVSTEWLRFGEGAPVAAVPEEPGADDLVRQNLDFQLAREVATLSPPLREAVRQLVRALLKAEQPD